MENIDKIKNIAKEIGFDLVGVAKAEPLEKEGALLEENIAKGYYGNMKWLEETAEKRKNIFKVMSDVKSVICVALNYRVGKDEERKNKSCGQIARYAYGRDYHKIFDKKLKLFSQKLKEIFPEGNFRYYSDTGPIMDRAFAVRAGLGFIGKNTNLITQYGSWVLLGEIITNQELSGVGEYCFEEHPQANLLGVLRYNCEASQNKFAEDERAEPLESGASVSKKQYSPAPQKLGNNCGSCRRCLDVCPTGVLENAYTVNASKCISYLTIEYKGDIPLELRDKMGNWIFGCDMCQEVCPFNIGRSAAAKAMADEAKNELTGKAIAGSVRDLKEILSIKTDEEFLEKFAGSPVMRAKRRGLVRNACVAAGNSEDESLLPYLKECLKDDEVVIISHAKWAIEKLEKVIK